MMRRSKGLQVTNAQGRHIVFAGNPGTGKTTIAKFIGKISSSLGLTRNSTIVTMKRAELIGGYVGVSEKNVQKAKAKAKGGILFIDEAHELVRGGGEEDYGPRILDAIMADMEHGDPLVIFAGYPGEMGKLLNYNEGMARRIGHTFHFSDYIPHELAQIVQCQVKKREFTCEMTDDDMARLVEQHTTAEQRSKLNGGLAEKLLEKFEDAKLNRFDEDTCTDNFLTTYSRDEIEEAFNTLTPNILEGLTSSVVLK